MSHHDKIFVDPNQPSNFRRRQRKRNKPEQEWPAASKEENLTCAGSAQLIAESSALPMDRASLLESPNSTIEIQDGQFNATAGNHFSITINAGDPELCVPRERVPTQEKAEGVNRRRPAYSEAIDSNKAQAPPPVIAIQRSCDIYYRHLAPKGRGSPLWIPEPNKALNIEYQRTGMRIGDVGIISSRGSFDFLFNICLPTDHPINPKTLPENFVPLLVDPDDIQKYSEFKGESYLSSASVKRSRCDGNSSGLLFESSATEGAILTMPVGSNSEDLGNVSRFRKYAALHAENWYQYVNNVRGREARNGDIRLVTGYDKTSAWGMATFSNATAQNDSSLHLTFRPKEQGSLSRTYDWEYSGMAEVRAGPDNKEIKELQRDDPSQEGMTYENQCLFVRTLNITLQHAIWEKLESEFGDILIDEGPGDSSSSHGSSSQNTLASGRPSTTILPQSTSTHGGQFRSHLMPLDRSESGNQIADSVPDFLSSRALIGHPSELLNEMLLKVNPTARIAITEDKDWIPVMTEEDTVLPSTSELYFRVRSLFNFREEEECMFLEKREELVTVLDREAQHTFYPLREPSLVAKSVQKSKEARQPDLPRPTNSYSRDLSRPVGDNSHLIKQDGITRFQSWGKFLGNPAAHTGTEAIDQESVLFASKKGKYDSKSISHITGNSAQLVQRAEVEAIDQESVPFASKKGKYDSKSISHITGNSAQLVQRAEVEAIDQESVPFASKKGKYDSKSISHITDNSAQLVQRAEVVFSSIVANMDEWAHRTHIPRLTADALGATYTRAHGWLQTLEQTLISEYQWTEAPSQDYRLLISLTSSILISSVDFLALKLQLPVHASSFFSPERQTQWKMIFHSDTFENVRKICPPVNDILNLIQCLLTGLVILVSDDHCEEGVYRATRGLPPATWVNANEQQLVKIFGPSRFRALQKACNDTEIAYKVEIIPHHCLEDIPNPSLL